jgi:hypothetical protein
MHTISCTTYIPYNIHTMHKSEAILHKFLVSRDTFFGLHSNLHNIIHVAYQSPRDIKEVCPRDIKEVCSVNMDA